MTKVFVSMDSAALSMGANEVAEAISEQAAKSGHDVSIVRNGSRGMLWLEPLVEVETPAGRVGYANVLAAQIPELLAAGFLTGKYQPGVKVESVRAEDMPEYMNERGWAILQALTDIAAQHNAPIPATALAWLRAQPGIAAPIASARTPEQLAQLLPIVELSQEQIARVNAL
jgi:hypothetical protein